MRAFWTMLCGLALGFGVTAATVESGSGFGAFRVGPWTAWPRASGPEIDPYARAGLARRGEAPLGRDEGLVFAASADSAGGALDGRCDYHVADPLPAARYWTLGLASPSGAPLANPAGAWWERKLIGPWLPPLSVDNPVWEETRRVFGWPASLE